MGRKFLILVVVILSVSSVSNASTFSDLPKSHWAYDTVMDMKNADIISGFTDGTFKPNDYITREQFASILKKVIKEENKDNGILFADVEDDFWSKDCIYDMSSYINNYIKDGEYYFKPFDNMIREDVAVSIVKALNLQDENVDMNILDNFKDSKLITKENLNNVAIAIKYGIMSGNSNGMFNPKGAITRAEVSAVIRNVMGNTELPIRVNNFFLDIENRRIDLWNSYEECKVNFVQKTNILYADGYREGLILGDSYYPTQRYLEEGKNGWTENTRLIRIKLYDKTYDIDVRPAVPNIKVNKLESKFEVENFEDFKATHEYCYLEHGQYINDPLKREYKPFLSTEDLDIKVGQYFVRKKQTENMFASKDIKISKYSGKVSELSECVEDNNGVLYRSITLPGIKDKIATKDRSEKYESKISNGKTIDSNEFGIKIGDIVSLYDTYESVGIDYENIHTNGTPLRNLVLEEKSNKKYKINIKPNREEVDNIDDITINVENFNEIPSGGGIRIIVSDIFSGDWIANTIIRKNNINLSEVVDENRIVGKGIIVQANIVDSGAYNANVLDGESKNFYWTNEKGLDEIVDKNSLGVEIIIPEKTSKNDKIIVKTHCPIDIKYPINYHTTVRVELDDEKIYSVGFVGGIGGENDIIIGDIIEDLNKSEIEGKELKIKAELYHKTEGLLKSDEKYFKIQY